MRDWSPEPSGERSLSRRPSPAAVPAAVLAALEQASLAHIVAHGIFISTAPMQSVLFLAQGCVLPAREILHHNLTRLDLVTLAACQTGLTGREPGSEPSGFLRAFLAAGARRVLLTGWEVDDTATSKLFTTLYSQLQAGPPAAALRVAQLALRRQYHHPYYWAGVTLHGNWH